MTQTAQNGKKAANGLAAAPCGTERALHELEEAYRELALCTSIALHDLVQPFQVALGYLAMIEDGQAASPTQVREWAGRGLRSLRRTQAMLESLVARSRGGPDGLRLESIDFGALVSDVLVDLAPTIADTGASVEIDDLPTLVVDPVQVRELVQNLLANGLKFSRAGVRPRLRVTAARHEDTCAWRLAVTDNGEGIPPDSVEEVFEPFYRGGNGDRRPGSGLGLYICKRIVERHGGAIWIEAVAPSGTRVSFTVPDRPANGAGCQSS